MYACLDILTFWHKIMHVYIGHTREFMNSPTFNKTIFLYTPLHKIIYNLNISFTYQLILVIIIIIAIFFRRLKMDTQSFPIFITFR